jgi:hypothetical protein
MTSRGRDRGADLHAGKVIAVDIDDTLNDFTQTLRRTPFPYHPRYALPEATFHEYLAGIRDGAPEPSDLLSTAYLALRFKIHEECYRIAIARADGVEFMKWLRDDDWRIVICTRRDLRRVGDSTKEWLAAHRIPFDYMFSALNKIAFCRAWHISLLVDDEANSIEFGPRYGVRVFYPASAHGPAAPAGARGFGVFDEVKRWIRESR